MVGRLAALRAAARTHPVAVALELGTVVCCALLFLGTILTLANGRPAADEGRWLAIVVTGAGVVVLWTLLVPLYERFLA